MVFPYQMIIYSRIKWPENVARMDGKRTVE
jgi:hypothetical protein